MSGSNLPIIHVLYISSPVKDTVVVNDRWGGTLCAHGDSFTCADKYHPGKLEIFIHLKNPYIDSYIPFPFSFPWQVRFSRTSGRMPWLLTLTRGAFVATPTSQLTSPSRILFGSWSPQWGKYIKQGVWAWHLLSDGNDVTIWTNESVT